MFFTSSSSSMPMVLLSSLSLLLCYPHQNKIVGNGGVSAFSIHPHTRTSIPSTFHPFQKLPSRTKSTSLKMSTSTPSPSPPPLPDTDDPFLILGLSTPTADPKQIKRAYKRRALQYHPDVRIGVDSTEEEKRRANDDFARINSAYAFLSGKDDGTAGRSSNGGTSSSSSSRNGGSTGSKYEPPHRRSAARKETYSSDWRDYVPNYENDERYDAGGDSFEAIFRDFVSTAAAGGANVGKMGSGGILDDLISFLEGNFASGIGNGGSGGGVGEDDLEFIKLINTGSVEEVKNELDDAVLLTRQLDQKDVALKKEYEDILAEGRSSGGTTLEEMRLEEKRREVEARRDVVRDYLDRARERRKRLMSRYEELCLEEELGVGSRSRSRSSTSSSSSSSSSSGSSYTSASSSQRSTSSSSTGKDDDEDDSWKRESFGSRGRRSRRGGSRSRSRSARTEPSSSSTNSYSSTQAGSSTGSSSSYNTSQSTSRPSNDGTSSSRRAYSYTPPKSPSTRQSERTTTTTTTTSSSNYNDSQLPPHRRIGSNFKSTMEEDKKRMREIKVEEEIEAMRRELGL